MTTDEKLERSGPIFDEIPDIVKGRKASGITGIIILLTEILLITSSRQSQRKDEPLSLLKNKYMYCLKNI